MKHIFALAPSIPTEKVYRFRCKRCWSFGFSVSKKTFWSGVRFFRFTPGELECKPDPFTKLYPGGDV